MQKSKAFQLPKVQKLRLGQNLSILSELAGPLKQLHSELASDWEIRPLLSLYRQLGAILISAEIELEAPLSLQCVGLLISETLCKFSSQERILMSAPLSTNLRNLLRGIFHYLNGKVRQFDLEIICFRQAARVYKTMLTDFLDRNPSLPGNTSSRLVGALEILNKIGNVPFLLIAQAVENIMVESQEFSSCQLSFTSKSSPFLPAYQHKKYTLVLDLDGTLGLVHNDYFCPRPGLQELLDEVTDLFEVVSFTANSKAQTNQVLSSIGISDRILLVLHREHTTYIDGRNAKDLSLLGRQLTKVILVDSHPEHFGLQPENAILLSSWTGDPKDTQLYYLKDRLKAIYKIQPEDVRTHIHT